MPNDAQESLQGWTASLENELSVRQAVDRAFDYRGDVTVTLKDGRKIEGYIFDRRADSADLAQCVLRLMPKDSTGQVTIRYADIATLVLSGRDTAAGRSFQTWIKKYQEKKAAGEKNIRIDPEKLD